MSATDGLETHPIFASSSHSPVLEQEWEVVGRPNDLDIKPKQNRLVVRDKDLIVASGNEVRITSLQQSENGSSSYSVSIVTAQGPRIRIANSLDTLFPSFGLPDSITSSKSNRMPTRRCRSTAISRNRLTQNLQLYSISINQLCIYHY